MLPGKYGLGICLSTFCIFVGVFLFGLLCTCSNPKSISLLITLMPLLVSLIESMLVTVDDDVSESDDGEGDNAAVPMTTTGAMDKMEDVEDEDEGALFMSIWCLPASVLVEVVLGASASFDSVDVEPDMLETVDD